MDIFEKDGIAFIKDDGLVLTDLQSALDLIANVGYQTDSNRILIFKENVSEDFFKLSNGLLGDVFQKFVTYNMKIAIVGDFSKYTSKPLQDFIYESNKGRHIFFAANEQSAIEMLNR